MYCHESNSLVSTIYSRSLREEGSAAIYAKLAPVASSRMSWVQVGRPSADGMLMIMMVMMTKMKVMKPE
jgi:hypothetical protein